MIYPLDAFPGRSFVSNDKEYLYFGGTAYLGLQAHRQFQDIYIKNIRKYGTGYSASRASNVRFKVYEHAEQHLATTIGCQECFTLSSGYLASQLAAMYFANEGYALFYAPKTHVALHTGTYKNATDSTSLAQNLQSWLAKNKGKNAVVLLDTIDFFGANYPDFTWLKALPLERIIIVADDSHGFGITGTAGNGSFKKLQVLHPKELLVCGSLGKGYGIQAGVLCGSKDRIQKIQTSPIFAASSPAVPAAMATYLEACEIYHKQQNSLQENIHLFTSQLKNTAFFYSMPKHPAFSFKDNGLTAYLEKQAIVITNFPYPNDSGNKINRIVLAAHHISKDIKYLCKLINTFTP